MIELETKRLLLRQWKAQDLPVFAALNSDPEVMKYFPALLNREQSDALALRCKSLIAEQGWGFWAVEIKSSGEFIGFEGLNAVKPGLPFYPAVEIGWRLDKAHWGKGYATEAARAAVDYAFNLLQLNEVVSFTSVNNMRSRALMQRLGMTDTQQNFQHPDLPSGHALSEHVLYRITRKGWEGSS